MLNPPAPHGYLAFDILKALDDIKSDTTTTNTFDILNNIVGAFKKLKDPHTSICTTLF